MELRVGDTVTATGKLSFQGGIRVMTVSVVADNTVWFREVPDVPYKVSFILENCAVERGAEKRQGMVGLGVSSLGTVSFETMAMVAFEYFEVRAKDKSEIQSLAVKMAEGIGVMAHDDPRIKNKVD